MSSGSDWHTEATGAHRSTPQTSPLMTLGRAEIQVLRGQSQTTIHLPLPPMETSHCGMGRGVSHPMLVSTAATLEDWERESIVNSASKRDRGEETDGILPPSTKLLLFGTGVDVTSGPVLMLLLGPGVDVTPGPV